MKASTRSALFVLSGILLSLGQPLASQENAPSTARSGITILKHAIFVPYSASYRTLRIYTPPSYQSGTARYPVIYALDGQNLFDRQTSYAGEWRLDETLDSLAQAGYPETIVVGIDNHGAFRGQEYNLYASETFGPGLGAPFLEFIVKEVKPLIDNRYRTLTGRENTTIMGSSLGGIMAYAGLCMYPEAFKRAGVFSPSFWIAEDYFDLHRQESALKGTKVYLSVGAEEGPAMVQPFERMRDTLLNLSARLQDSKGVGVQLKSRVIPGATHSESHWSREFVNAYIWWTEERSGER